jgi:predicted HNH restriction endonuclease
MVQREIWGFSTEWPDVYCMVGWDHYFCIAPCLSGIVTRYSVFERFKNGLVFALIRERRTMTSSSFTDARWIDITRDEHEHGGVGWEFGHCLWSPSKARNGSDRYAIMREPRAGDIVINFSRMAHGPDGPDTYVVGFSTVVGSVVETRVTPPKAAVWSDYDSYYRIDLRDFTPFPRMLSAKTLIANYKNELRREIVESHPKHSPLATYGDTLRLTQGLYLGRTTPHFLGVLSLALGIEHAEEMAARESSPSQVSPHREFSEGQRLSREVYFFARNPRLARAAKQEHGYACQCCGFSFAASNGELGNEYIECHHLNPLSERSEVEWSTPTLTSISDVAVVCSNCHRMLHRLRPPLSISDLRAVLAQNRNR